MDNLEPFQCVHIGVQGTRSHPAIQGDSQAGSIPGGPVLTVALDCGGGNGRPLLGSSTASISGAFRG